MTVEAATSTIFSDGLSELRAALDAGGAEAAGLWPTLERLDWVALLPSAAAPGFVYLAAACGGEPVGGGGRTLIEAAGRCAGEAAEVLAARDEPPGPSPGVPASLGLGAGVSPEAARLAGLLELIERDAADAWWQGAARARALDVPAMADAAEAAASMRRGAARPRAMGLLDLTARAGVRVVCALSCDPGGRGLALGLKASLHAEAAAWGATIELMQMELALELALRRGDAGGGDAGPLGRAALDLDAYPAFDARPPRAAEAPPESLAALVERLGSEDVAVTFADLATPPDGLSVARAVAPALMRPRPSAPGAPGAEARLL